ncbi:uncharacterized protein VICG_00012 [Vittaforma corneae ATCC 50505]|uniref:Proteasome alpha-type subunits domain-containing protein n=1 Tax=Vittaforma corneae (strain ATCC 50505) TaxID=993615 RepID=L2GQV7_VITCO|nr:uncharacterized protein VICG_00012 [Vittaforma corneae ATCC 50505]ELA42697.1 hypothetical protein VICG_00012 [Vittaforma corneae ATCC 50505]
MGINEQIYNTFNDEGRLLQLEYGMEALYSSYQTVSILSNSEIIFVSKKVPQQPLQAESHNSIYKIGNGLYVNITGLPADIDYIVNRARTLAASTEYTLGCKVTPDIFATILAEKLQENIQTTKKRSPSFALTIGGFEKDTPMLYYSDMSAVQYPCFASAAGEDYSKMVKYLEKHYKREEKEFAIQLAISSLLQSIGKEAESTEIQVGVLSKDGIEYLSDQQINEVIQNIAENN